MYQAKVIADSISPEDHRITTMEVVMPRMILAEFNTHRMFSRNSASSRAIKFEKMATAVRETPFSPLKWMRDHTGMQGSDFLNEAASDVAKMEWLDACTTAIQSASILNREFGLTKQICNRLLEPFMWHKVLVTATEWENFFALRFHKDAEIHMQYVAELMLEAINNSTPEPKKVDEWHIPYGETSLSAELIAKYNTEGLGVIYTANSLIRKIATAKCAQVSYTIVGEDGKPMDQEKLIALHDRLAASGHWSPFEHCARVMNPGSLGWTHGKGWWGNFHGWKQYRKEFTNENRIDPRFKKWTYGEANQKG